MQFSLWIWQVSQQLPIIEDLDECQVGLKIFHSSPWRRNPKQTQNGLGRGLAGTDHDLLISTQVMVILVEVVLVLVAVVVCYYKN